MKNKIGWQLTAVLIGLACASPLWAAEPASDVKVVIGHNDQDQASGSFKLKNVPKPSSSDAASNLKFSVLTGDPDSFSGGVIKLNDGKLPSEEDEPGENFFFNAGTDGGRLLLDLGKTISVAQINTYSWHSDSRAPQVYDLYASDGMDADFSASPSKGIDPAKRGWKLIAKVNTRSEFGKSGGQYGVSVSAASGNLGKFRYLLFDCRTTEDDDAFGNTFYSEIDVIDADAPAISETSVATDSDALSKTFDVEDGKYQITINAAEMPELADWGFNTLAPVLLEWYPKLIAMLPSEGFSPATHVTIKINQQIRDGIPAYTSGNRITLNGAWFKGNLKGEATGAVIHETVHVLQHYWSVRRNSFPGWLTEGIPDYIRFFKYEPQNHGADDAWLKRRDINKLRYDQSYRITANFLEWVTETYDKNIVVDLNSAARQGKYTEEMWKTATQKTLPELGEEWLDAKKKKFAVSSAPAVKTGGEATASVGSKL